MDFVNRYRLELFVAITILFVLLVFGGIRYLTNQNRGQSRAMVPNNAPGYGDEAPETWSDSAQSLPAAQTTAVPSNNDQARNLIPDSELIYGPTVNGFKIDSFVPQDSYLRSYTDVVENQVVGGVEVVQLIAERFRVNPRLLLAALEYRSGWVTQSNPQDDGMPLGLNRTGATGLYSQLEWTANRINMGYYGRSEGGLTGFTLADGTFVSFDGSITDGTAGVQNWFGAYPNATYSQWLADVGEQGFTATYERLFGDPFAYADDSLWPTNIEQPELSLPWDESETWYFTGGPHGGWASGSAWAALDFVPPGELVGCYESAEWVLAVADGVITRSDFGAVVLDLDGDGYAGTGWAILYQHIATNERIASGTRVSRGDRLGHPSCEGGYSTGTHLHLARTYNGRWISADQAPTFNLDGWLSSGFGNEYDGSLVRGGLYREAAVTRADINAISAER